MYVLEPVHYYLVVESAPDVMQRIQLGDADTPPPGGRIIIPDSAAVDGFGSDNGGDRKGNPNAKGGAILNLLVGRVVWVGPGKNWEGHFVKPDVSRGDLVLFSPRVVSHELRMHGHSYKIVPWSEVISKVHEVSHEAWAREVDVLGQPNDAKAA